MFENMDVLTIKLLSLVGIFIFSILFGLAPLVLEKCIRSPKVKWFNNVIIFFSGGTLIGISFLHLMPETRESMLKLTQNGYFSGVSNHVSMADVIICAGFFLIYLLDELIHILLEYFGGHHIHQPHGRRHSLDDTTRKGHIILHCKDEETQTSDIAEDQTPQHHANIAVHIPGLLTIVALSFHDIFEGLAIGIQDHSMDVIFLFLSVATHKYSIAFSVSLDFLLSGVEAKMIILYTICFSIVNPFGIGLGIIMDLFNNDNGSIDSPITVLMQGLASGSLIYVTCFEVLQRHGSGHGHIAGIRNVIFVIFGFVSILLLKIYLPHSHLHVDTDDNK